MVKGVSGFKRIKPRGTGNKRKGPRPTLNTQSFLNYVFHPKSAPKPLGIRKSLVTSVKWKTSRRSSFNKMEGWQQQVIRDSGQLNSYLTGQTNFNDAKRKLREDALSHGVVLPKLTPSIENTANWIDKLLDSPSRITYTSRDKPTLTSIKANVRQKSGRERSLILDVTSYDELYDKATDDSYIDEDGRNPYWY